MGRHDKAIKRFIIILFSIPLTLAFIAFIFVNPIFRTWISTYTPWISLVNLFYFTYFLISGLVALLFELPFTQPDTMMNSGAGKFGTLFVGIFGGACLVTAAVIFVGWYSITTDTGYFNTVLGFVLMPGTMIMFAVEMITIVAKGKRFAFHPGAS